MHFQFFLLIWNNIIFLHTFNKKIITKTNIFFFYIFIITIILFILFEDLILLFRSLDYRVIVKWTKSGPRLLGRQRIYISSHIGQNISRTACNKGGCGYPFEYNGPEHNKFFVRETFIYTGTNPTKNYTKIPNYPVGFHSKSEKFSFHTKLNKNSVKLINEEAKS